VAYVAPNDDANMHSGTIAQGDQWLQNNLGAYAQWAVNNDSLLVVVWDESDSSSSDTTNQVAAILYGAHVVPGNYNTAYNDYNLLSTILGSFGLTAPNNAATAAPIQVFGTTLPAAPTIASPANGSTDTTTAEPAIAGTGVSGDTVTVSIDGTVAGTAPVVNSAWSFTPTSPLSNASHTVAATQAAAGAPSSTAATDTFTVAVSNGDTAQAEDGYISGATVFADANGTGQLASNDVSTTTDANGNFTLTGGTGPLIAFGGTDISTGLVFKGQLDAPSGSTVIDPLTTLISGLQQAAGLTVAAAEQEVLAAFGLASSTDLTTLDPGSGAHSKGSHRASLSILGAMRGAKSPHGLKKRKIGAQKLVWRQRLVVWGSASLIRSPSAAISWRSECYGARLNGG
jgi:hypothetical protein